MHFRENNSTLYLEGICDFHLAHPQPEFGNQKKIWIDCSKLEKIDFSFVIFLDESLKLKQIQYELIGASKDVKEMFSLIACRENFHYQNEEKRVLSLLGERVYQLWREIFDFCHFFGLLLHSLARTIAHPSLLRFSSLLFHIGNSGFKALPVGLITCAIVSSAISVQGVLQLQKIGVPIISVETLAKLSLREMGPFILALVIAGRSASSFTAQIGAMRITEELDAMKIMGFDWYRFIVLPRFLALVIAMPFLVFLADIASLFASAVVIKIQTGITFQQYLERFYEYVGLNHLWVGVVKSPFFGGVIAIVGCYRGLQIAGDTQSVGKYTTMSVVNALFWIIVVNAIFSVLFTRFDL